MILVQRQANSFQDHSFDPCIIKFEWDVLLQRGRIRQKIYENTVKSSRPDPVVSLKECVILEAPNFSGVGPML